jgi:hypothetical protein
VKAIKHNKIAIWKMINLKHVEFFLIEKYNFPLSMFTSISIFVS